MADRELEQGTYTVDPDGKLKLIKSIQSALMVYPTGNGVRRAKGIVQNGGKISGFELKRLKNFFDNFNQQTNSKAEYELAGGGIMKAEVERILNTIRSGNDNSKKIRQDMTVDPNLATHAYQTPRLSEAEDKDKKEEKQKNAVAVIVNVDNKILLLKRADIKDIWMPGKWALVGGMIEKGETPQKAVEREISEETGLEINKFTKTFSIQRNPNSVEHVFACRYDGDPTDITLNNENTNYGWYDVDEMNYLDIVPHLIEYITLSFKKYD
jgi:8-oxo-dGTP pyrophosphatase MutT (NUDIX family)